MPYNTRIAPSPTGMAHIGTFRTAYFNFLAARSSGGKFILRIDDSDVERNRKECVQPILDGMEWLGLDYDEIHYQSDRVELYQQAARKLKDASLATELDNGALSLVCSGSLLKEFADTIAGNISITDTNKKQIEGTILLRGEPLLGAPTYQFASVFDDIDMGINWIIRGHDHISNTPKQITIWQSLTEAPLPKFSHIGLIHKDKKKLSKRDGAASLMEYKAQGYSPDAILNFLLRLGWGPHKDDKTTALITKEQALELFLEHGSMKASPANFDQAKLDSFNRKYKARK